MNDKERCPFCGSDKSRIEIWTTITGNAHKEYAVMCENCGCFGPNDLGESGAVESWNRRRLTDDGLKEIASLKRTLENISEALNSGDGVYRP